MLGAHFHPLLTIILYKCFIEVTLGAIIFTHFKLIVNLYYGMFLIFIVNGFLFSIKYNLITKNKLNTLKNFLNYTSMIF